MRAILLRYPNGLAKAVTFSYDDGVSDDIRLSETLTKYKLKGTFNHNAFLRPGLNEADIFEHILSKGHELALHGEMHRATGLLKPKDGIQEILNCKLFLEKLHKRIIRGFAYPDTGINSFSNGTTYDDVKTYLKELEVAYARVTICNSDFMLPNDFYEWKPTAHHSDPKMNEYIETFLSADLSEKTYYARRLPMLFYIWGHSYEFSRENNWDLLENICEKLSGHSDIWYATNIEIYDYVNAYNSLIFSLDNSMVYNPSLFDVWFDIDGKLYVVKSGETLNIC